MFDRSSITACGISDNLFRTLRRFANLVGGCVGFMVLFNKRGSVALKPAHFCWLLDSAQHRRPPFVPTVGSLSWVAACHYLEDLGGRLKLWGFHCLSHYIQSLTLPSNWQIENGNDNSAENTAASADSATWAFNWGLWRKGISCYNSRPLTIPVVPVPESSITIQPYVWSSYHDGEH
jgi:hypothetical protein